MKIVVLFALLVVAATATDLGDALAKNVLRQMAKAGVLRQSQISRRSIQHNPSLQEIIDKVKERCDLESEDFAVMLIDKLEKSCMQANGFEKYTAECCPLYRGFLDTYYGLFKKCRRVDEEYNLSENFQDFELRVNSGCKDFKEPAHQRCWDGEQTEEVDLSSCCWYRKGSCCTADSEPDFSESPNMSIVNQDCKAFIFNMACSFCSPTPFFSMGLVQGNMTFSLSLCPSICEDFRTHCKKDVLLFFPSLLLTSDQDFCPSFVEKVKQRAIMFLTAASDICSSSSSSEADEADEDDEKKRAVNQWDDDSSDEWDTSDSDECVSQESLDMQIQMIKSIVVSFDDSPSCFKGVSLEEVKSNECTKKYFDEE